MHPFGGAVTLAPHFCASRGTRVARIVPRFWAASLAALVLACAANADPHTIEGALAKAADALARRDAGALYWVIDERARHAMDSVVKSRRAAAEVIRKSYPEERRAEAMRELGDAAEVQTSQQLFQRRCDDPCLDELARGVGAPTATRPDGAMMLVTTARGSELRMFRGKQGTWGLAWNYDALARERNRASAELELVKKNAALYDRQRTLK